MDKPLVSVILPVYNAAPYLKEALESVLNQTHTNFECIVINDGSTDNSEEIIKTFSDTRIRYYKQTNRGLGATLNQGLEYAKSDLIARQDQDDISYPQRLEKQFAWMQQHSQTVLLGARARIISADGSVWGHHNHATTNALLRFDLIFDNPFVHSSVMFRRSAAIETGGYNTNRAIYEDYDLWSKLALKGELANLAEVLVDYRHHEKGMSKDLSNFRDLALYDQGMANAEKMLNIGGKDIANMLAVYHLKPEKLSSESYKSVLNALHKISVRLVELFPQEKNAILLREKHYRSMLIYRLNKLLQQKYSDKTFKLILLKIVARCYKLINAQ